MSLKTFVSRSLAVQSSIVVAVGFSIVCNFAFGQYLIGYDLPSSVFVGAIVGALIASVIGVTDFLSYYSGRTKDFLPFNIIGIVSAISIYNCNVLAHLQTSGWTVRGLFIAVIYGLLCGNVYAASCAAVKMIAPEPSDIV